MKKIIAIGILGMFLTISIASIGVIANKQQIGMQNTNEPSEEVINRFLTFIEKQENLNIDLEKKQLIKQAITSVGDGNYVPGIYIFNPCDPIDIHGVGSVGEYILNESEELVVFLHEGTLSLNNSFNHKYVGWEIAVVGIFTNYSGEWDGFEEYPFKSLNVTGNSEFAALIEFSFLLQMSVEREKYKRGAEVPVEIKRMILPEVPTRTLELVNPHFYVFEYDEETGGQDLIYEEILQETWDLPLLGTKTWNWNQKDNTGNQVPDGNYSFVGEFEIDGIVHPVIGPIVEIVDKLDRNRRSTHPAFMRLLDLFPNAFSILQQLLNL